MALTEATRDAGGKTLTFIQTRTDEGIVKAGLSAYDLEVFNTIDTDGTGADLQEKMEAYTLSNSRKAWDVYGRNAYNMDDYAAVALQKAGSGAESSVTLADHGSRLDDHGSRLDAAEPRLDTVESSLDDHGSRLDTVESSLDDHGSRLDTAESSLTDHGSRLDAAEPRLDTVESRLDALEGDGAAV